MADPSRQQQLGGLAGGGEGAAFTNEVLDLLEYDQEFGLLQGSGSEADVEGSSRLREDMSILDLEDRRHPAAHFDFVHEFGVPLNPPQHHAALPHHPHHRPPPPTAVSPTVVAIPTVTGRDLSFGAPQPPQPPGVVTPARRPAPALRPPPAGPASAAALPPPPTMDPHHHPPSLPHHWSQVGEAAGAGGVFIPYAASDHHHHASAYGHPHVGSPTTEGEDPMLSPYGNDETARMAAEDKRRRNTAASARFRVKKKQREQALERSAKEISEKVVVLEDKIQQLEMENKWLRDLVMEKNKSRDDDDDYDDEADEEQERRRRKAEAKEAKKHSSSKGDESKRRKTDSSKGH